MAADSHLPLNTTHTSTWQTISHDTDIVAILSSVSAGYGLLTLGSIMMVVLIGRWVMNATKFAQYEFVNKAGFWDKTKARDNYLWNARKLLLDGFSKVFLPITYRFRKSQVLVSHKDVIGTKRLCYGDRHGSHSASIS